MILKWNSNFDEIDIFFRNKTTSATCNKIAQDPCSFYTEYTDLSNLVNLTSDFGTDHETILNNLIDFFNNDSKIIFYHGCCPKSVNSYYEKGLIKLNNEEKENALLEIIEERHDLNISVKMAKKAIADYRSITHNTEFSAQRNKVYCTLDHFDDGLFHEFLLGSEYLRSIIQYLPISEEDKLEIYLHNRVPTLFTLLIPFNNLDQEQKAKIISNFVNKWISFKFLNDNCTYGGSFDFEKIETHHIQRHEHPNHIHFAGVNLEAERHCDKCKESQKFKIIQSWHF